MTVAELIVALKGENPEAVVVADVNDPGEPIAMVYPDEGEDGELLVWIST